MSIEMRADRDDTATAHDENTIQGLWLTLLRLVPHTRRFEARALANTLHYLLTNTTDVALEAAQKKGFEAGYRSGKDDAAREAARDAIEQLAPARPPTLEDEMEATLRPDKPKTTKH